MSLDIVIEDDRWLSVDIEELVSRAVAQTLAHMGLSDRRCEVVVMACDDHRIAELNAEFRDKSAPTNVLSWPAEDLAAEEDGAAPAPPEPDFTGEIALGDIAISYDTCMREAEQTGKIPAHHITHLVVHGVLHLLGYDHIRDRDATLMEELEVSILGTMGIDDPYISGEGPLDPGLE